MASILDDFKSTFRDSSKILQQIIVITCIVFVVNNLFLNLAGIDADAWFALPGSFLKSILFIWSYVTYMFLHAGIGHILFNMLILYWFGRLLVEYLGSRKFTTVYFVGGILGGLFYVISFNVFQLLGTPMGYSLIGASAGVMSVMVATAVLLPDYEMRLFLFGNVKIKYIALVLFVLNTLLDFSFNTGGKLAHLGGALFGLLYITQLRKGVDFSINFYKLLDFLKRPFASKPKMRVVRNEEPKTRSAKRKQGMTAQDRQRRVDEILDKIGKSGYDSLTKEEKDFLFQESNKN
jgi:membrane associated rhomboid family serine protease